MGRQYQVAVFVGSLRKGSYSRSIARAMAALAPGSLQLVEHGIGHLPFYNQEDDEGRPPQAWTDFRREVRAADAVLFVTPEYNRSVPAVLKNALDIGSRPYGQSVWDGKPGAVVSISPGGIGGFGANHHLRQMLVFLNVPTLQQPEAYLGSVHTLLDAEGRLANQGTRDFLANFLQAFAGWIEANRRA